MEILLLIAVLLVLAWLIISVDIMFSQGEPLAVSLLAGFLTVLAAPIGFVLGVTLNRK